MPVTIELDDYEVANLREGLLFLRTVGGDTGDWLGQILLKLPVVYHASDCAMHNEPAFPAGRCTCMLVPPNKTAHEQQRALAGIVGWRLLFS